MMRNIHILLLVVFMAGCSQTTPPDAAAPKLQGDEITLPAAVTEAAALLIRSTGPGPEVDQALTLISVHEDRSMRFERTIKVEDGSLHIGLQQRYPKLGIVVHHYDQKFTHASRIPVMKETSNQ